MADIKVLKTAKKFEELLELKRAHNRRIDALKNELVLTQDNMEKINKKISELSIADQDREFNKLDELTAKEAGLKRRIELLSGGGSKEIKDKAFEVMKSLGSEAAKADGIMKRSALEQKRVMEEAEQKAADIHREAYNYQDAITKCNGTLIKALEFCGVDGSEIERLMIENGLNPNAAAYQSTTF